MTAGLYCTLQLKILLPSALPSPGDLSTSTFCDPDPCNTHLAPDTQVRVTVESMVGCARFAPTGVPLPLHCDSMQAAAAAAIKCLQANYLDLPAYSYCKLFRYAGAQHIPGAASARSPQPVGGATTCEALSATHQLLAAQDL